MSKLIKVIILVTLLLINGTESSSVSSYSEHQRIAPVAVCDTDYMINIYKEIDECHLRCSAPPQYINKSQVTIMKDVSDMRGPPVVLCSKVRITQVFTETWTFSTMKGLPEINQLTPTEDECRDFIKDQCSTLDCNLHAPEELEAEYHFASDTKIVKDFLVLRTVSSAYYQAVDGDHISPADSTRTYLKSYGVGETKVGFYFWDKNFIYPGCPFTPGITIGCDKTKIRDRVVFLCSEGRLSFEAGGSVLLQGGCEGVRKSAEGIMFKDNPAGAKPTEYDGQRIGLISDTKYATDIESLRIMTANALAHLDSDVCSTTCELAALQLRTARNKTVLIRSGDGYSLLSPKGFGYRCSKVVTCVLSKPYAFCGSPPRIGVRCNGQDHYWDPTKSYIVGGNGCKHPSQSENLFINTGNAHYSLDDDLSFRLNDSDTDTHLSRGFLLRGTSLFTKEDLPDIRAAWKTAKIPRVTSNHITLEKSVSEHSFGLSGILSWASNVGAGVMSLIKNTELLFVITIIIVVMTSVLKYLIMPFIYQSRGKETSGRRRRQSRDDGNSHGMEESAVWI